MSRRPRDLRPASRAGLLGALSAPLPVAVALLVLLSGCERAPATDADDPLVLDASAVHVVGTSDRIAVVRDLEPLADGTVWVLNSVEPLFLAFGPDGALVAEDGRRGGGPDELGRPAGFVAGAAEGGTWVFDRARHALIRVSRPGARREVRVPEEGIPRGSVVGGMGVIDESVRTARLGEEWILPRRAEVEAGGVHGYWLSRWSADLVALDPRTGDVRVVVPLAEVLGDPTPHFRTDGGFPPFPLWYRLWTVCSDGTVRVHDRLRNEVRGFGADGVESDPVPLPPPPFDAVGARAFARVTFDLAVVEAAPEVHEGISDMSPADSARILEGLESRLTAPPEDLATLLPRYVDLRCGDDGALWLRPLDLETGGMAGGPAWLRVGPDGGAREVRMPDGFDPFRFTAGRIWGVQRDEVDRAAVAWIETPANR